jgi:hypothetical protein
MTRHARIAGWAFGLLGLFAVGVPLSGMPEGRDTAEATAFPAQRWPMRLESEGDRITIFEPQLETFLGDSLTGRAAVSIAKDGEPAPTFGAIWFDSQVTTNRVTRTVRIDELDITRARIPGREAMEWPLTRAVRKELLGRPMVLPLDTVLIQCGRSEQERATERLLQNTPPKIVYRSHPAIQVQYDGKPVMRQVGGSGLMRVINTPFLVVLDPGTKTYYLKGAGRWFGAPDALGPFQESVKAPAAIRALADQEGYKDPEGGHITPLATADVEIVTATTPTELIWTDGSPTLASIADTDLLYMTNTTSSVFFDIATQNLFVLLSGRWYTAKEWDGLWAYVPPDTLPYDFRKIPPGSEKGAVLAHVPGTETARNAILDSYVPRTAAIDRRKAEKPVVTYDGKPEFKPVGNSRLRYAVNTDASVLELEDRYYCCDKAVWHEGPTPTGPWEVCVNVPPEIYDMPPSSPLYPTTYVHVYDVTPDVVYTGYLPGYVGCYPYDDTIVYGTGYWYPGWYGRFYRPWPCTFGYGACFDPFWGGWGFNVGFEAPDFWLGRHSAFHGGWWGNGGFHRAFKTTAVNNAFVGTGGRRNALFNGTSAGPAQMAQADTSRNIFDRRTDVRHDLTASPPLAPGGASGVQGGRQAGGIAGTPRSGDAPSSRSPSMSGDGTSRHEADSDYRGTGRDSDGGRSTPPASHPSSPSGGLRGGGSSGGGHSGSSGGGFRRSGFGDGSGGGFRSGGGFNGGSGGGFRGGSGFSGGGSRGGFRGGGGFSGSGSSGGFRGGSGRR